MADLVLTGTVLQIDNLDTRISEWRTQPEIDLARYEHIVLALRIAVHSILYGPGIPDPELTVYYRQVPYHPFQVGQAVLLATRHVFESDRYLICTDGIFRGEGHAWRKVSDRSLWSTARIVETMQELKNRPDPLRPGGGHR